MIKIFLLSLSVFFYSCASTGPVNLTKAKNEVIGFYESGLYEKELRSVTADAMEDFQKVKINANSVVIFDIDETVLSNYKITKELDFGYIPEYWDKWIFEAQAPAIEPVKELYDLIVRRGAKVIFITGRKDYHYEGTYKNLVLRGFTKFDTLITKSPAEYAQKAVDYKSRKRKELAEKGYEIIGSVGDQLSDLEGGNSGLKIKIPNYIYLIE